MVIFIMSWYKFKIVWLKYIIENASATREEISETIGRGKSSAVPLLNVV